MGSESPPPLALLVDWGGVMTTDLFASFRAFCELEGLAPTELGRRMRDDESSRALVIALETGTLQETEFERAFATRLGVKAEGLVDRLFAGSGPDPDMQDAVLRARRAGIATGLLSNSWGTRRYPRERLAQLFDSVTISGEVGLRKPAPEIYALAAERAGVPAERCVFVDDIAGNLEPAAALGMTTVHHRASAETIAELERVLGTQLR
jgi:epoxide hydrolase-like predicted phosphatase